MISADPQRLYIAFDWNILYLYLHVLLRDSEKKRKKKEIIIEGYLQERDRYSLSGG